MQRRVKNKIHYDFLLVFFCCSLSFSGKNPVIIVIFTSTSYFFTIFLFSSSLDPWYGYFTPHNHLSNKMKTDLYIVKWAWKKSYAMKICGLCYNSIWDELVVYMYINIRSAFKWHTSRVLLILWTLYSFRFLSFFLLLF